MLTRLTLALGVLAACAHVRTSPAADPAFDLAWARAACPPPTDATFALAWSLAKPCDCNGKGKDCPCATTPAAPPAPAKGSYEEAFQKALAKKAAFVVWVGHTCPPCEAKTPQYVHWHTDGPLFGVKAPAVIVGEYRDGYLWPTILKVQPSSDAMVAAINAAAKPAAKMPQAGPPVYHPVVGWPGSLAGPPCPTCR